MNFRHLHIFLSVCEQGSMTRAAKHLYLAQPSVSQAIAELEQYYNTRLFERLNHRLYLTAAGERLRFYASHILNLADQAQKEMADLSQGGVVRVGASLTVGAYLMPSLLAEFRRRNPQVEVYSQVDNTTVLEKLILEDQLDVALVEGPVASPHVVEEMYCHDDLVFIAAPQHFLAGRAEVDVHDLRDQYFIVREPGSGTQAIFEHAMHVVDVNWNTAGVYNNIEAIKLAVSANLGVAVVSRIAITEEVRQGKLARVEVRGVSLKRRFNLIYHRQKFFTRAMQLFWDTCIDLRAAGARQPV